MFGWAGAASALLRRSASPRADNSGSWCDSIAGKESPKNRERNAGGSPIVPRYLGKDDCVHRYRGGGVLLLTMRLLCRRCPINAFFDLEVRLGE
jgi:hypothetical protein